MSFEPKSFTDQFNLTIKVVTHAAVAAEGTLSLWCVVYDVQGFLNLPSEKKNRNINDFFVHICTDIYSVYRAFATESAQIEAVFQSFCAHISSIGVRISHVFCFCGGSIPETLWMGSFTQRCTGCWMVAGWAMWHLPFDESLGVVYSWNLKCILAAIEFSWDGVRISFGSASRCRRCWSRSGLVSFLATQVLWQWWCRYLLKVVHPRDVSDVLCGYFASTMFFLFCVRVGEWKTFIDFVCFRFRFSYL